MIHLRAGIHDALLEASSEGHCGLPTAELLSMAGELPAGEGRTAPVARWSPLRSRPPSIWNWRRGPCCPIA